MFYARKLGSLTLSDSPDFQGTLTGITKDGERTPWFWGDIGTVSASAFALTIKQMDAHDLWISILSSTKQIILEPSVSFSDLFASMLGLDQKRPERAGDATTANTYVQPGLTHEKFLKIG